MRSLLIWVGVSRTTSCEKSVYMINKSVTMLEKLRHTVEMRVRRCHIHMRPNHMNAAVSKWHKLSNSRISFVRSTSSRRSWWMWQAATLFRRISVMVDRSQKFRWREKIKHLSKYWVSSTQDDPCRSNIGGSRPLEPLRRWRLCYHQTIINTRSTEARHCLFKCLLLYVWRIEIDFNETI